jgi:hypothetical protein
VTPDASTPPDEVETLARERASARASHDFARADLLKASIEAAGWRVTDRGTAYRLDPAAPPTIEAVGVVRHGSAETVPSLIDEPASARFTVLLVADERPDDLARILDGLRAHAPGGTQVVIVANDPSPDQAGRLVQGTPDLAPVAGAEPELVWTSARLGHAVALNAGLRRARGEVIVLAEADVEVAGDALTPLAAALADPSVAVAGGFGLAGPDLRHLADAAGHDVDAIDGRWLAFRRSEVATLGPLDEKFIVERWLDTWWSLVLRAGPDPDADELPRRAVRMDLPLVIHERAAADSPHVADSPAPAERDRLARRNFYRVLERFRGRADLLSGSTGR